MNTCPRAQRVSNRRTGPNLPDTAAHSLGTLPLMPHLHSIRAGKAERAEHSCHLLWTRHLTKICMLQSQEEFIVKDETQNHHCPHG